MSLACLVCLRRRLYLLPLITTVWIIISFFITYGIAVSYGHTEPDFPYISHTAIEAPERCVFGQLLNIGALLLGMNALVRYLYLNEIFKNRKIRNVLQWQRCNIAGMIIGVLSALGMSIVANFQTEVQRGPHYAGAVLAFLCGTTYCILQTKISWNLRKEKIGNKFVAIAQIINTTVLLFCIVIFVISKTFVKIREHQGVDIKHGKLRGVYLLSTITEWMSASLIVAYALTYIWDFRFIVLESPKVTLNFSKIEKGNNNTKPSIDTNIIDKSKDKEPSISTV